MLFGKQYAPAAPKQSILLLVDGTKSASRAVELAFSLAKSLAVKVFAVEIVETETLKQLLAAKVFSSNEMTSLADGLRRSAKTQLEDVVKRGEAAGVEVETMILEGNCEQTIPIEVEKRKIIFAIVGHFDSGAVKHDLLLRQRQQICDRAPCPVMIAR